MQAKALSLSTLTIEGDFAISISQVVDKERGSWKFDNWMRKIVEVVSEMGCSLSWVHCSSNQVVDQLAKQGAKHFLC